MWSYTPETYKNSHLLGKRNDKILFMIAPIIILRLKMKTEQKYGK